MQVQVASHLAVHVAGHHAHGSDLADGGSGGGGGGPLVAWVGGTDKASLTTEKVIDVIYAARQQLLLPTFPITARYTRFVENPQEVPFFNFVISTLTSSYKDLMLTPDVPVPWPISSSFFPIFFFLFFFLGSSSSSLPPPPSPPLPPPPPPHSPTSTNHTLHYRFFLMFYHFIVFSTG